MTRNFRRCNFGLEFGCGGKAFYRELKKAGGEISIVIGRREGFIRFVDVTFFLSEPSAIIKNTI